ncbi:hypothetical protein CK203_062116 [Vitis vinifera]|uniref:Uncharacterized protein n=1 Tax=Vitis vinifera TaxID=29760 RepID=A0A438FR11_VITVI|nr:hypothetical protein CK203_062116 [Vitis vinifera]
MDAVQSIVSVHDMEKGYDDIVKQLCCHDDHELLAPACAEAEDALAFLSTLICLSPIHWISFRSLLGFLGVIPHSMRGLEADNNTYDAAHDIETAAKVERKWIRPLKEGTNQQGGAAVPPGLSPVNGTPDVAIRAGSKLNPFAKEWNPWQERAPEEDRSLFITFSNGYPLSNFQIWQFFTTLVLKPQANLLFPSGSTYVYKGALTQNSTL